MPRIFHKGTSRNDRLLGLGVSDVILGKGGNDLIRGRSGNDKLLGDSGNDKLYGESGHDELYGGSGNDRLTGGTGNDKLYGGSGNDKLYGGSGNDRLSGGSGNDKLYGGSGNDKLYGGAGNDRLYGASGNDYLSGSSGNDKLYGGGGNDRLIGGAGNDYLVGSSGHDTNYGGSGNDRLYGGSGSDQLFGSSGNDKLYGGSGNDRLYGGSGHDQLSGGSGNDKLYGGSGNDRLLGGSGDNELRGGSGVDTAVFSRAYGDYDFQQDGNFLRVTGPEGSTLVAGDVEILQFADRSVDLRNTSPLNQPPVLIGDLAATLEAGTAYVLTAADLGFTDPDDTANGVEFTVSNLTANLKVQLDGADASSFTAQDIAEGKVTLIHDGSATSSAGFGVTVEDGNEDGSAPPAPVAFNVTVTAPNEMPDITVGSSDSASADFIETDTPRTASGTLTVTDINTTDSVNASVGASVTVGGTAAGDASQPSEQDLLAMFSLTSANPVIGSSDTTGTIGWAFDSGTEAFDYLEEGETLELTYTVEVSDGEGGTDSQDVTIAVTGTDDDGTPDIYITSSVLDLDNMELTITAELDDFTHTGGPFDVSIFFGIQNASNGEGDTATSTPTTFNGIPTGSPNPVPGDLTELLIREAILDTAADTIEIRALAANFTSATQLEDWFVTIGFQNFAEGESAQSSGVPLQELVDTGTDISLEDGDSASADLIETDNPRTASGTLTVTDRVLSDEVTASLGTSVTVGGTAAGDASQPSEQDLLAMFSLTSLNPIISGSNVTGTIGWEFDSGTEAFDYLEEGETLELTYTVQAADSEGPSDTQDVTITITGTDDDGTPDIYITSSKLDLDTMELTITAELDDFNHTSFASDYSISFALVNDENGENAAKSTAPTMFNGSVVSTLDPIAGDFTELLVREVILDTNANTLEISALAANFTGATQLEDWFVSVSLQNLIWGDAASSSGVPLQELIDTGTDISVEDGDSASADLIETDNPRTASGTLTVTDRVLSDEVTASLGTSVTVGGTAAGDASQPSEQDLLAMFSLTSLNPIISGSNVTGTIGWAFDSGAEAFDYLEEGETLELTYTVMAADSEGPSDTQDITITITGTDDDGAPDIYITSSVLDLDAMELTITAELDDFNHTASPFDYVVSLALSSTYTGEFSLDFADPTAFNGAVVSTPNPVPGTSIPELHIKEAVLDTNNNTLEIVAIAANFTNSLEDWEVVLGLENATAGESNASSAVVQDVFSSGTDIFLDTGDSQSASLAETDNGLTASGTLTARDLHLSDTVNAAPGATVSIQGTWDGSAGQPTQQELLNMFSLTSTNPVIEGTATTGTIGWAFDSGSKAFDYLADGQTLTLVYTMEAADGSEQAASANVVVTINGTDDDPDITVETGNSASADLIETDNGRTATGTLTVTDLDVIDQVTASVGTTVIVGGTAAGDASQPAEQDLLNMFSLASTNPVIANDATTGTIGWSFDSGTEAFDYLEDGETLTLTYTVEASDGAGPTDSQDVTITITGTDDDGTPDFYITSSTLDLDHSELIITAELDDFTHTSSPFDYAFYFGITNSANSESYTASASPTSYNGTVLSEPNPFPGDSRQLLVKEVNLDTNTNTVRIVALVANFSNQTQLEDWTINAGLQNFSVGEQAQSSAALGELIDTDTGDNPVITLEPGDSDYELLSETDGGVSVSGTLTVTDLDQSDTVNATVFTSSSGGDGAFSPAAPTDAELLSMFSLSPNPVIDGSSTTGTIDWSFDSSGFAFDYLLGGEVLFLNYVIEVSDGLGPTDTHTVRFTIAGTDDDPDITVETGDSAGADLIETDAGLSAAGTLTVTDLDQGGFVTRTVAATVGTSVTIGGTAAGAAGQPTEQDLLNMFSLTSTNPVIANDATTGTIGWSFDSGTEAFNYLDDGETLELTYTVVASDGDGPTDSQDVTITITGTNDAPTIADLPSTVQAPSGSDVTLSGTTVDDADSTNLSVAFSVGAGALALTSTAGLTMTDGDGSDGTLAFSGAISDINAALANSLVYSPDGDYTGDTTLTMAVSDGGAGGDTQEQVSISVFEDTASALYFTGYYADPGNAYYRELLVFDGETVDLAADVASEILGISNRPLSFTSFSDVYTGDLTAFDGKLYFNALLDGNDGGYKTLVEYDPVAGEVREIVNHIPDGQTLSPGEPAERNDGDETYVPFYHYGTNEYLDPRDMTVLGDKLYFTGVYADPTGVQHGRELLVFDGNTVELAADVISAVMGTSTRPFGYFSFSNEMTSDLTVFDGKLYFNALLDGNDNYPRTLVEYDPENGNVREVVNTLQDGQDPSPSPAERNDGDETYVPFYHYGTSQYLDPQDMTVLGDKLYFTGVYADPTGVQHGRELLVFDGNTVELAADVTDEILGMGFFPTFQHSFSHTYTSDLTVFDGKLYFNTALHNGDDNQYKTLAEYDPATGAVREIVNDITDVTAGNYPAERHDGDETYIPHNQWSQYLDPQDMTVLDGKLYFTGMYSDPTTGVGYGRELLVFDGQTVELAADIITEILSVSYPTNYSSFSHVYTSDLEVFDGKLYFNALLLGSDNDYKTLVEYDPNGTGTSKVREIANELVDGQPGQTPERNDGDETFIPRYTSEYLDPQDMTVLQTPVDNTLTGTTGNDLFLSGQGADTFHFDAGFGQDTIVDFTPDEDLIEFASGLFVDQAAVLAATADDGLGNTVVALDANNTVTLEGVLKAQLDQDDFVV